MGGSLAPAVQPSARLVSYVDGAVFLRALRSPLQAGGHSNDVVPLHWFGNECARSREQYCTATSSSTVRFSASAGQHTSEPGQHRAMAWNHAPRDYVLLIILASLIGRVILAATIGLGVDESYQVSVSRPLSLSYFEHPPLAFWIPGIVASITGSTNAVLLRLPFILLFAGTTWMMYRLTRAALRSARGRHSRADSERDAGAQPEHGSWVLPDGPLMFWMLASALCLERVLLPRTTGAAIRGHPCALVDGGGCVRGSRNALQVSWRFSPGGHGFVPAHESPRATLAAASGSVSWRPRLRSRDLARAVLERAARLDLLSLPGRARWAATDCTWCRFSRTSADNSATCCPGSASRSRSC